MKWRIVPKPKINHADWHLIFLWKPIRHGDFKYWLCFMYRRLAISQTGLQQISSYLIDDNSIKWEYKEPNYV